MTSPDALAILDRRITDFYAAPEGVQDVLINRLHRLTAPVLEEREQLLSKLERGHAILWDANHTNQPVIDPEWPSIHPEIDEPSYQEKADRWIVWLSRLQQIEDVLARFPRWDGVSGRHVRPATKSATPLTKRSVTTFAQPP